MIEPRTRITVADVAAHYDDLDWLYRDVWGEHVHHGLWLAGNESPEVAVRQLVRRVAEVARVGAGSAVCDLGCGYGATARRLAADCGARVTGITLSRVQFDYAVSRAGPALPVRYILGDWLDNDLPDAGFDAVIAIESTEHIADKERCFAEIRRVLRPGGRLAIAAWFAADEPRAWEVRHLLEPICREGRILGLGSEREYVDLLGRTGFAAEPFEDLTRRVRRTWSVCIGRMARGLAFDRRYRRYVADRSQRQRVFALTLLRIWIAYRTGTMRYGLLAAARPGR